MAPADPQTDTLIRVFTNRLEDGTDWRRRALPSRLAPTEGERDLMRVRVSQIDRWLGPSRRAAIVRSVELMRANLVIANGASDDAVEGYVLVLTPFPEPVVEDVCRRYMDGRFGGRIYAPMPAEIAHECRLAVADALAERGRITLILDPEVYQSPTEEDRIAIAERHAAFVKETALAADTRPVTTRPRPSPEERVAAERDLAERKAALDAELKAIEDEFGVGNAA